MPVADRVRLPAQVRLVRLEGAKQVYHIGGVLVRCDHVTELTTAHACCMLNRTRIQLDSGEEHPLLFCSPRQSTVRPYSLVMFIIKECPGTVLEEKNYEFLQGTYRSFTHTHQPWT